MQNDTGVRSYPIKEALDRLGVGNVKGYGLINSGELESFTIGRRRYVSEAALQRFIQKRVAESLNECPEDRTKRVEKAVQGRRRQREELAAA
jgi:excisionase family DNA binding protein